MTTVEVAVPLVAAAWLAVATAGAVAATGCLALAVVQQIVLAALSTDHARHAAPGQRVTGTTH